MLEDAAPPSCANRSQRLQVAYDGVASVPGRAAKHAGGLYGKTFIRRQLDAVEGEAEHLHEVEQQGESGETPFIAILGVIRFQLPIFAVMLGLALAAYYLVG